MVGGDQEPSPSGPVVPGLRAPPALPARDVRAVRRYGPRLGRSERRGHHLFVHPQPPVPRTPATFEPPYTIAIVTLDEGPRLVTNVTGDSIRCDTRVRLGWKPVGDGRHLPVFETDPEEPEETNPEENRWTSV